MKGKFIYIFADGSRMTDRNGYKTLASANLWAKAHNKSSYTKKSRKVVRIIKVKSK